jgi:DNA primase
MALPTGFLEELRARTPLAPLISRRVRLARSGRQWKGCCPFHGEKTPSFYVYDDHYHCFGCGAHGDAISFVMQSQGAGFGDAVAQLAAEAGMEVPKASPEAAAAEQQRHGLHTVLAAAAASFQRRLFLPEGRRALDYLLGRGLTEAAIRRFGLGWSGDERGALTAALEREGMPPALLLEAGLMRRDEESGRTYEFFSGRVMFPIRDRRGRVISFGGRLMGEGQPKYLNGPETPVFSKRRSLYGLDLAWERLRADSQARLVIVEGYLDVIAVDQAEAGAAVAPLGTALTAEQLEVLWRLSPVPVLCFDGDAAGARAAARAADLALPLLAPDRSLQVCSLPAGQDPDSLIRESGFPAFLAALAAARPLAEALYDLLREQAGEATPEQRAALRAKLEDAARRIPDRALASEYRRVLLDRFYQQRASRRLPRQPVRQPAVRVPPRPAPTGHAVIAERGRILTAILLHHPALFHDVEHAYAGLDLSPGLTRVRDALRDYVDRHDALDSRALIDHLTNSGFQADVAHVLAAVPVPLPGYASPTAMPAEAEAGWWHIFGFLNVAQLRQEVAAARAAFTQDPSPDTERRLVALSAALSKVLSGEPDGVDLAA